MPCVPQARDSSGPGRAGIAHIPRMERDGTDLHQRPYITSCAGAAHKLVRHPALDVSRYFVEVSLCGHRCWIRIGSHLFRNRPTECHESCKLPLILRCGGVVACVDGAVNYPYFTSGLAPFRDYLVQGIQGTDYKQFEHLPAPESVRGMIAYGSKKIHYTKPGTRYPG